jgi:hypothetical protein
MQAWQQVSSGSKPKDEIEVRAFKDRYDPDFSYGIQITTLLHFKPSAFNNVLEPIQLHPATFVDLYYLCIYILSTYFLLSFLLYPS